MKPMEIKQYVSIVSEWFATVMPQTQSSLVHRQLRASASLQKSVKVEQKAKRRAMANWPLAK